MENLAVSVKFSSICLALLNMRGLEICETRSFFKNLRDWYLLPQSFFYLVKDFNIDPNQLHQTVSTLVCKIH